MAKLLVVPHPAHLTALTAATVRASARMRDALDSVRMMTTDERVGAAGASGAPEHFEAPPLRDILDQRHEALSTFAAFATASTAKGISAMRGMATATARVSTRPLHKVLASLGAIIMDEETVDRRALEQTAAVFENVLIPLVVPYREIERGLTGQWSAKIARADTMAASDAWHLDAINIGAARAQRLTGRDVLVGVLDTGVDASHPELAGRLYNGSAFAEFDRAGELVSATPRDAFDHGTHVCGLIAGQTIGVAPNASLAVAAVLTYPTIWGPGGYLAQIAAGLDWLLTQSFRGDATDPGVDVINASLAGSGYDSYLYTPLAQARLALGTLMIAAIGNSGEQGTNKHGSPGNYDITLGVGAVNQRGIVAPFSDWGTVAQHPGVSKPDMCAPGVDIWSAVPGGKYEAMSGTSMATPLVTGAAALLLEQDATLSVAAANLQRRLFSLTTTPPSGPKAGRGRLDLTSI